MSTIQKRMFISKTLHTKCMFALTVLIVSLCFMSCTKKVAGPKGDSGTAGLAGNLKQTSITSFKVLSNSWSLNDKTWEFTAVLPNISGDVIEKGEVNIYREVDSKWWPLPYGNGYIFTQYSLTPGTVRFNVTHIHGGVPERPADANYRLVILYPAN
jgi:hypothetical protein